MYTIGEFAKFTQTTVKALRYYDEIGLLKPSQVDFKTGFRYYDYIKFSELEKIIFFKELNFSLKTIKELLDNPHLVENTLATKKEELIKEQKIIDKKIKRLNTIRKLNQTEPPKEYYISPTTQISQTKRYYISLKKNIWITEIDTLVSELLALVFSYKIPIKGHLIGHFNSKKTTGKQMIQLMFEVASKENVPSDYLYELPKGDYLSVTMIGLYAYLPYGYDVLKKELPQDETLLFFEEYVDGLVPEDIGNNYYNIKPIREKDPRQFVTTLFVKK